MAEVLDRIDAPAIELFDDRQFPHMITFEYADGSTESLCYKDLLSVKFRAGSILTVRFITDTVVIEGRNLLPVWRALRSRSVRLLRAGRPPLDRDAPRIDSLTVTPLPE